MALVADVLAPCAAEGEWPPETGCYSPGRSGAPNTQSDPTEPPVQSAGEGQIAGS